MRNPDSSHPASAFAGPLGVTARRDFPTERLQTRIDRLAFKGEYTEDAFVDAAQRFLPDKSLKCLNSESELAECQGTLGGNRTTAQTLQVLGQQVFRPIDNSQVFFQYRYIYFNGMRVSREEANDWVDHYGLDALGNVRYFYGYNGTTAVEDYSDFYPFGGERIVQSFTNNHYKFTGKERDSESGLDNFGARFDSSTLGRFLTPDDIDAEGNLGDPQGLNLYSYVQNNPTDAVDPDGHDCVFTQGNTAYVARGDCSHLPNGAQNATYVAGTVDQHSGKYDRNTGTLSFDYKPYSVDQGGSGGLIGKGVVGGIQPTHPGLTEFEKFASRVAEGNTNVNAFVAQTVLYALLRGMGEFVIADVNAAIQAREAEIAWKLSVDELKELPPDQYKLVQEWIGKTKAGSPVTPPPPGLTREAMEAYLKVAKAYVARGSTVGGEATQIARIRTLQAALGHQ